ncbi:hypothetical protein [Streptomonospora wellingtoniae]|uniref:Uncharacterized protein n=1 Tax=Streptomonospora wellingtoniae TaxID=3075544 RepID=A0ABU2KUD3_9ACTN|nr:hypothetical protein [Streptomonospora sp. DSM 45055]MDT0302862.1 hypothetical protein [Streptomonospora sp. DSM 45055]
MTISPDAGVETLISASSYLSPGLLWLLAFGVVPVVIFIVGWTASRPRREMVSRQIDEAEARRARWGGDW